MSIEISKSGYDTKNYGEVSLSVSLFNGLSKFVSYLMPKPVLIYLVGCGLVGS